MKLDYAGAADERGVHLEERVLRGSSHQHEHAVFDRMEQRVLLTAVEAVDLVDEQDGSKALHRQALFRGADLAAQVGHGAADGGDFHKGGFRVLGDDVRERGLPRARGP